jgi:hypothetical protein
VIPTPLLDDLVERLTALDADDLFSLHCTYDELDGVSPGAQRFARALQRTFDDEWRRRNGSAAGLRLDDLVEAVDALTDHELGEALAAYGKVRRDGESVLPPQRYGFHETVGQMLLAERLSRQATDRRIRRAMLADVPAGWGRLPSDDAPKS